MKHFLKSSAVVGAIKLDRLDVEKPPSTWTGPYVGLRIVEGFETLLKASRGLRLGYASSWPTYLYEFADLAAQADHYELERTHQQQNRVRIKPSPQEITAMEKSTYWPAQYLSADPELMVAVNSVSLAYALGRDAGWVAEQRGGYAGTWRQRHDRGSADIALGLVLDRVAVF
jgi:hypothetical protein